MAPPRYRGGRNLALKIPAHEFDDVVHFYTAVLALPVLERDGPSLALEFGRARLWLDRCPQLSQAELWLEVVTDDLAGAERHLRGQGVRRCDGVEELPAGLPGFWIAAPGNVVHLVTEEDRNG